MSFFGRRAPSYITRASRARAGNPLYPKLTKSGAAQRHGATYETPDTLGTLCQGGKHYGCFVLRCMCDCHKAVSNV